LSTQTGRSCRPTGKWALLPHSGQWPDASLSVSVRWGRQQTLCCALIRLEIGSRPPPSACEDAERSQRLFTRSASQENACFLSSGCSPHPALAAPARDDAPAFAVVA